MNNGPIIGISIDIYFAEPGNPARDFYWFDAKNFPAFEVTGATTIMLPHVYDKIDHYLDMIDGLMVSGGSYQFPHPQLFDKKPEDEKETCKFIRTQFEVEIIKRALNRDMPVFTVCGGFQTLNHVLGGPMITNLKEHNKDWAHHRTLPYPKAVHAIQVKPGTLLEKIVGSNPTPVNSLHKQGVIEVGAGAIASAVSEDGLVEAVEHPDYKFCLGGSMASGILCQRWRRKIISCLC